MKSWLIGATGSGYAYAGWRQAQEVMMHLDAQAIPVSRPPRSGSKLNVLGVTHVYKATGAETAGAFSLWEAIVPPGAGAPPHTHSREDESFYVLGGELLVEAEGEAAPRRIGRGGFFFGARGRRHAFRNTGDKEARVLVLSTPSRGLDEMFAEIDAAMAEGGPEIAELVAIAAGHGVTIELQVG